MKIGLKNRLWILVLVFILKMQLNAQPNIIYGKYISDDNWPIMQIDLSTGSIKNFLPDSIANNYGLVFVSGDHDIVVLTKETEYKSTEYYAMEVNTIETKQKLFTMNRFDNIIKILDTPKTNKLYIAVGFNDSDYKTLVYDRSSFDVIDTLPVIGRGDMDNTQEREILSPDQTLLYRINQGKEQIEFRSQSLETSEMIDSSIIINGIEPIKQKRDYLTAYQYCGFNGYGLYGYTSTNTGNYNTILVNIENKEGYIPFNKYTNYYGNTFLSFSINEVVSEEHAGLDIEEYYHTGTVFIYTSRTGEFMQLVKFPSIITEEDDCDNGIQLYESAPNTLYYFTCENMAPPSLDSMYTANLDYIQPADSICSTMLGVVTEYNKPEVKLIPDNDVYDSIVRMIKDAREYLRDDNTTSAKWMLEYFLVYLEAVNTMDASQYSSYQQTFAQEMMELKATLNKGQPATTIISKMQERITGQALQKSTSSSDSDKVLSDRAKNSLTYISQKILDERL